MTNNNNNNNNSQKPPVPTSADEQLKMAMAWQELQRQRIEQSKKTDWASLIDEDELKDPKNIKVDFGPMLTEEQFKAHLQSTGVKNPTIVRTSKK